MVEQPPIIVEDYRRPAVDNIMSGQPPIIVEDYRRQAVDNIMSGQPPIIAGDISWPAVDYNYGWTAVHNRRYVFEFDHNHGCHDLNF